METFSNKVAAITGAGSGIGRALAVQLAAEGCRLALSDIDEQSLAETVRRCGQHTDPARVSAQVLDVSNRAAMFAWADGVVAEHGKANLIFNNAGVSLEANVAEMSIEDFEWLMNINFWGVVHGTQAFLPHLRNSGDGHVVNISSVFGLVSIPTQSAYNAAKFGVRGFTDALRIELEIEGAPVSATTIHPGGIKTNIMRNGRTELGQRREGTERESEIEEFEKAAMTTPDKAAEQILTAVRRNRRRALIGPDAKVFDVVSRLPATVSQRLLVLGSRRRKAKAELAS